MTDKNRLKEVNKEIADYNKKLIKLLQSVNCTHIDFYQVVNEVEYLKHKKQMILFDIASNTH